MGDWGLSLLLILSTVVYEISAVHNKPYPWQSRHGFLSNNDLYPPTPLRRRPPTSGTVSNPFSIQSNSRQKTAKTPFQPFQSEQLNPIQRCVKRANDHTSPSSIRDLILSIGKDVVKRQSFAGANLYHQRGLRRFTRSQVHETHFLLPFITKIGSHFGDYLRKVLGCQAEHRTYIAQPRSSRLSALSVDPVHSISSSSSNEQPQPHPSFIFERSAPQSPRIPLLPPPKHIQKPLSQGARAPIYSRPQHIQPIEQYDASTSESFPKLSVSPSRPIQRSFHVDNPSSPGFEDIPNPDGTSSITQSSRSDSSAPQPFEELLFSPPPVDMSGLPPPVFAGSDSSTSALPDIVQAISDSSTRFTPADPSITFTAPGLQPHRMTEISLLPTTIDPTGSPPPPPSSPFTTFSLTSHPSHTSLPPSLTTSSMTSTSRLSPSSQPGQSQGSLYFGPPRSDVKVLVEANGVLRQWRIAVPPMFGIIDLLRYLAREQAEPINLSTLDPHCFVLTRMLGLRINSSHVWTVSVITFKQEVIFQDRCLPSSNLYILPGYTLVFRYTQT
ncbi:uncharacterized protein LOC105436674 [Strongylocentrotus purpuratus]|uniref:Flocculation protein FLO11-like n=1 Tax=Strongylocentrotus purpuratus TaxID=7668 RepID=A0A7M7HK15_STRPU|nr:uncharacterized protein LOC105436674 [Strongylocentrotus purpuratus]XP_030842949.1 uncharacterized protein LOC105436674 [Strongylocentrotus purpuratus]